MFLLCTRDIAMCARSSQVLLMGVVLLVSGIVVGLWHFRRQTWGMVGSSMPKYRNLGMSSLQSGAFSGFSSKGTFAQRQQLVPGMPREGVEDLRTDVAPGAGPDGAGSAEGSPANPLLPPAGGEPSGSGLQVANAQPGPIPNAASEFEEAAEGGYHFDLDQMEDDFWDYERQVDLEGFNVRMLYDKLEDQTIHMVSQLANHKDDTLLLYNKILGETESLKEMIMKVNINVIDSELPEGGRAPGGARDSSYGGEVGEIDDVPGGPPGKMKGAAHPVGSAAKDQGPMDRGHVHYELPPDLKDVLTNFLRDTFRDLLKPEEEHSQLKWKHNKKQPVGSRPGELSDSDAGEEDPADAPEESPGRGKGKSKKARPGSLSDHHDEPEGMPDRFGKMRDSLDAGDDEGFGGEANWPKRRPSQKGGRPGELSGSDEDGGEPGEERDAVHRKIGQLADDQEGTVSAPYQAGAMKDAKDEEEDLTYDNNYRDINGRRPGEAGFIPPGWLDAKGALKPGMSPDGLPEGGYDDNYRDINGRKPGEEGFIPPSWIDAKGGLKPGKSPDGLPEGGDEAGFHDQDGNRIQVYDNNFRDINGRRPGEAGFIPPAWLDAKGALKPGMPPDGLPENGYDDNYRDINGRKPGDAGFIPPSWLDAKGNLRPDRPADGLPEDGDESGFHDSEGNRIRAYDDNFRDHNNKKPGQAGFIPPGWLDAKGALKPGMSPDGLPENGYDDDYRDINGRAPGERGFVPPGWLDAKGNLRPDKSPDGLPEDAYDEDYHDLKGRRVGDAGFLPPKKSMAAREGLAGDAAADELEGLPEEGYDDDYVDAKGRKVGERGFIPPSWSDRKGGVLPGKPAEGLEEGDYDQNYVDRAGRRVNEKGFLPPKQAALIAKGRPEAAMPLEEYEYDDNYVDENGKKVGERGFIPPKYLDPANRKKLLPDAPVGELDDREEGAYDEDYRDENGLHVGERGFIPPMANRAKAGAAAGGVPSAPEALDEAEYDENFRDVNGKRPGERGFIPPFRGRRGAGPQSAGARPEDLEGLPENAYDENYRDSNGKKAGQRGFVPPKATGAKGRGGVASAAAEPLEEGIDENFVDRNGKQAKDDGFAGVTYDKEYTDRNGRKIGQRGFIPPLRGKASLSGGAVAEPMDEGEYDCNYRDDQGLMPGDKGFVTPDGDVCDSGYDEKYVDCNGKHQGEKGFIPPCYDDHYRDTSGKRPGQHGFVPPRPWLAPGVQAEPLEEGQYDSGYRDAEGRKPGDAGFVPPGKDTGLEAGFDDNYVDANGKKRGARGFIEPLPTGGKKAVARVGHAVPELDERHEAALAAEEVLESGSPGAKKQHAAIAARRGLVVNTAVALEELEEERAQDDQEEADPVNGRGRGRIRRDMQLKGGAPHRAQHRPMGAVELEEEVDDLRYTDSYRDDSGKAPGQAGFKPPAWHDPKDPTLRNKFPDGLPEGAYDAFYTDKNGRQVGDKGFLPPGKAQPLGTGEYDDDFVDPAGRRAGERGFLPPRRLDRKGLVLPGQNPDGLDEACYDADYRDASGKKVGDRGFQPPRAARAAQGAPAMGVAVLEEGTYDDQYRDRQGRKPGEEGFVPPNSRQALKEGQYDDNYRDMNGKKAGERGFIPPQKPGKLAQGASAAALALDEGLDDNFVDANGRTRKDDGFVGPTYGADHLDVNGLKPGEEGFTAPNGQVMREGAYDENYRDSNGRRAGQRGFIPPAAARSGIARNMQALELEEDDLQEQATAGPAGRAGAAARLPRGFVDGNDKRPGEEGFIPPSYDDNTPGVGEKGFVPPSVGSKGAYGGRPAASSVPLDEGCYDANYADKNGRRPGDRGFIPPKRGKARLASSPVFEGFDEDYRDDEGRKPGDAGFVPPAYDDKYRDANGKAPGEAGFVPPKTGLKGAYNAAMKPLDEFCYDENYRDSEGRKPGDRGFIPPRYAQRAKDPAAAAMGLEEGFDECYRDTKDRAPSESGFRPPVGTGGLHKRVSPGTGSAAVLNPLFEDGNGKRPKDEGFIPPSYDATVPGVGEAGFVPPQMGTKGAYGGRAAAQALPLEEGCYDANYADKNGRRPGDKGFVPPKGAKWTAGRAPTCVPVFEGFDENYRDDEGRKPGDTGFVPPVYDDKYRDANGKAPGEAGFVPPKTGLKGAYNAAMKPLDEFCYDENYRDSEGRKPGDRGFIPPRYAQRAKDPAAAAEGLEEGFDECYRDTKDCAPSESGFRPPVGTGGYHKPPTSMLVDPAYTDVNGKRAGEDGFIVPSYDAEYRDANGRRAGQKGFVPPLVGTRAGAGGKTPRNPQPLGEFCYDENYVDDKGRRPGDFGFVPPLAGLSAADRAKKALGLSEGFDEHYVDANGKSQGDAGFVPPCYTADYTDAGGRRPGEQGFVPPCHGRKGTYGGTRAARAEPLGEGEYDENYRDNNGRRPGDQGFIPPLAAKTGVSAAQMAAIMPNGFDDKYRDSEGRRPGDEGFQAPHATGFPHASSGKPLEAGYDQNFQDAQGRKATDADFIQPSYTDEYRDKNGRRPGQKGFLPPRRSRAKARIVHPLDEGEYDEDYRDAEGRGAGDRGFCPPPIRGRPSKPLAAGYDDFFVDAEGRHQNDKGFVPPQGSRGAVSAVRALPQNYDPLKEEKEEKKTVGHKPRAQMTRQQALAHAPQMTAAMELEEEEEPEPPQSQLTRAQRAEVQRTGREGARDAPSRTPEPGARKADAPRAGLEGARRTGPAREMDDEEDAGARRAAPTRPKRAPRDAEDDEYAEQETRERARRKRLDDDWLDRADKAMEKAAKMAESAAAKAAERAARKAVDDVLDRVVDKSVDRAVDRAVPAAVDKAVEAALGRYDRGARAPALDDDSEAGSPTRAPGGRGSPTKGALRSTQASPEVPELGASASSRGGRQRHQTKAGRTALDGSMALDELEQSDEEEMQDAAMSPTTQTATAPQKDRHTRERLIRSSADVKDADFEAMDKDGRLPGESGYRGPAKQRAPPARRKGDLSDGEMDAEKYIMTDTAFKGPGAKLSAEAKKRALEAILDDYFASLAEQPDENGRLPGQEGYVGPARQQALMSALRKAGQLADEPAPPMIEIARVASASPTRTPQQEPHAMSARSTASVAGSEDADGKTEVSVHVIVSRPGGPKSLPQAIPFRGGPSKGLRVVRGLY